MRTKEAVQMVELFFCRYLDWKRIEEDAQVIVLSLLIIFMQKNDINTNSSDDLCVEGNGTIISKVIEIDEIIGIEKSGDSRVSITYGKEQIITVTGDSNVIEFLEKKLIRKFGK